MSTSEQPFLRKGKSDAGHTAATFPQIPYKKVSVYEKIHGHSAVIVSAASLGVGIHGSDAAGPWKIYGDHP